MNKKSIRDLLPLVAICLIAAMLLAVFNLITEGPIAENSARLAAETRTRLLSSAATFEPVELEEGSAMDSCYEGFDAEGSSVGYVVETTVGGYGGEIVVTVGMDADNVITGINVGGENFSETAGLGALAKEAAFTDQFIGKSVPLKLVKGNAPKGDDTIDAISGATITSTAVNGGVNLAGKFVMDMGGGAASPNTGSVQGFAGPVAVTMQLDDAGAITELTIGDAFFNETEGFGAKALEPDFQAQFIGKVPPLTLADIDAIAGATITSQAVVDAVNLVHAQLNGEAPVAAAPEAVEPVAAASDAALKGSSQGFAGPVAVAVDLDDQGAITAITIGDDSFAETVGFGAKALDDAFKAQFIGKVAPLTLEDVDAIAGATITSKAVIEALNQACGVTVPEAEEEPEAVPVSAPASENALTASVQGFAGPVAVSIELDANGAISAITIGDESFAETPGFGAKALEDEFKVQFIGKVPPLALADIDAISGATVTSQAVVDAINAAVPAKEEVEVEETSAALTASVQGFAGPVAVSVELDANGAISAITIGDDSFAETPGFGAKALEDDFKTQFIGKVPPLALADIDAIAGATVTSQAVVDAINAAVPAKEEAAAEETEALTASVQGFAGPVAVSVELDANGAISAITIGDDSFAETPGFGAKALEDEFKAQFIGKVPPLALTDIDAIAGATVTSQAVVDAINAAVPAKEEAAAEETAAEETTALTGSVQGFAGPVTVSVELDANGAISAITIGDESFAETPGFGAKALEDDFKAQFIGKVPPLTLIDIDAIAGATVTSQAVVDAINAAVPAKEEAAVEEAAAEETAALTASVKGFAGPVAVSVELDANGAISAITIGDDSFAETPGFGAKALEDEFKAQFIGKVPPLALADIDAIAGATVTSQAVVDALNAAVPAKEEATAEETAALTASVQGFAGPVAVSVELDANGAISAITIGDDSFAETPGFG
ncbi:MAG: FMN-binding protein, partial [Clostridia bacterium]|nr:FMN-binding protein [Clostridia bacterium]